MLIDVTELNPQEQQTIRLRLSELADQFIVDRTPRTSQPWLLSSGSWRADVHASVEAFLNPVRGRCRAKGKIGCVHTRRRGNRVQSLTFWAGLLALLGGPVLLVVVVGKDGVYRASGVTSVLSTSLIFATTLVALVM